jgi:hypothetical protein
VFVLSLMAGPQRVGEFHFGMLMLLGQIDGWSRLYRSRLYTSEGTRRTSRNYEHSNNNEVLPYITRYYLRSYIVYTMERDC